MSEVRKRALDEDGTTQDGGDDQSTKRVATEQELYNVESVMVMKLLCPSSIIGAIIGRGGSVMNGFQAATNTKIKISQNNDFFPGTSDRVIAITGQPACVTAGLGMVIEKMCEITLSNDAKRSESSGGDSGIGGGAIGPQDHPSSSPPLITIRLLIPHGASGVVIGRAGAHIKEISALTDTRLQLADAADPFQTKERMVNISGAQGENVKAAALRVLDHLLANRSVGNFINTTPSYAPTSSHHHASHAHHLPLASQNPHQQQQHMQQQYQQYQQQQQQMNLRAGAAVQGLIPAHQYHNQPPAGPPQPQVATQMGVPDEMVGAVVGKGGVVLKGIQSSTGARIKVSQKGEFIAGTTNRSITIEGTQEQVHYAHSAIMTQLSNHQAKTPY